ncbi:PTS sugar transporter subunit IIC (plasmid) [Nicoliella spurrieriana]|uniref:PTS sugar transporter subunit IIC n=1 Tax=Nicoliella spurrieriana TaxID=2925830 RepID=A0A976RR20_9LACO|nr:PTS sugar transporter subunit IIC [Nicoliella spurrieriana]UQS86214.1 PTS sugar transporter subunit IIC [Nicoliella spurrieriana]
MNQQNVQHPIRDFIFKVLNGSAQGILIGVLPSAIVKYLLASLVQDKVTWALQLNSLLVLFGSFIPLLIGMSVACQFKMKPLNIGTIMIATGVASGSIKWATVNPGFVNPISDVKNTVASTIYIANGAGDVINAMIVSALAVIIIQLVDKYLAGFGAVAIIFTPLLVGGLVGLIGLNIAPGVALITNELGVMVETFTTLQPLLMSILIAMAYSFIIITPVSTVGISLAIALSGLGSGAAGVGVVATTVVLLINSMIVNKRGTSVAILLGAMKGMMPSVFKKPIMILAFMVTAAISAVPVALFNVQGTPTSAGFGWIGLVSPIQSMIVNESERKFITHTVGIFPSLITWLVIPIIAGVIVNFIFTKVLKLYQPSDLQQEIK